MIWFTEHKKVQTGATNKFPKLNLGSVRFFSGISQTHLGSSYSLIRFRRCLGQLIFPCGLLTLFWGMTGCAGHSPVTPGMVLGFTRAEPILAANDLTYTKSLQVRWLGAACYLVQLGDRVIFTDPFLTHHSLARVGLGGSLKSDPHTVSNALAGLPVPRAIFVGHSHYDHLLDAAECLKQPGWGEVPIYGSVSTRNLLHGYGERFTNTWQMVVTNASWQKVAQGIRYKAIPATHGRQLPLFPLLYPGKVNEPMRRRPRRASDFKVGDSYAFLFELSNDQATNTIYFVDAAHPHQQGFPDDSVKSVDVAILCAPTWELSEGYPGNILQRLKPRHIVASHYDNFFQVNHKATEFVPLADMDGFLMRTQNAARYPEFENILVPSVGSVLRLERKATGP